MYPSRGLRREGFGERAAPFSWGDSLPGQGDPAGLGVAALWRGGRSDRGPKSRVELGLISGHFSAVCGSLCVRAGPDGIQPPVEVVCEADPQGLWGYPS